MPIPVSNGSGTVKYIYYNEDTGCYVDDDGIQYDRYNPLGTYADEYGTDWYENFSAFAPIE